MKVLFSARARQDLFRIGVRIAEHNPSRAWTFVDELEASCLELSTMALAFEVFVRRKQHEIRRRPHGNYVILYRVYADRVDILTIVHGARNYRRTLFPKD